MRLIVTFSALSLLLAACATQKQWAATGGSRADATVQLAYEYGMFESPRASEVQALDVARSRCSAWGYEGAAPFGGEVRACTVPDGFGGCNLWRVSKEFQCTGTGSPKQ
jgi:hypothetical protein